MAGNKAQGTIIIKKVKGGGHGHHQARLLQQFPPASLRPGNFCSGGAGQPEESRPEITSSQESGRMESECSTKWGLPAELPDEALHEPFLDSLTATGFQRDALVMMPTSPLTPGSYSVTATLLVDNVQRTYNWSFTIVN